ncbi:MAG: hypothetical protein HS104_33355 [Polyangiaceae bacterium]|nr:hypothetical protein [Polyangiaceae bacterium]MCE7889718.1 hypothetical protein [Sorangiineae bacterium PRO1]MCL4753267.1 choice-of-anchor L domain-containing protein [Myxococcales bacterium]
MALRTPFGLVLASSILALSCSSSSTSDGGGGTGGAGGLSVPEGPPGSVGNHCNPGAVCDPQLSCNQYDYCQPSLSNLPSEVKQAVPPPDSVKVPANSPILLFTTGTFANVGFKLESHTEDGKTDLSSALTVTKLSSSKAKDIFVLTLKQAMPMGASMVLTLDGDIAGNLTFNVDHQVAPGADDHLGIEAIGDEGCPYEPLPDGWRGFGDAARIGATGSLVPSQGSKMLALSSGEALCGEAFGGTTSVVVSGPITIGDAPGVSFDYNFQSSEFDDYCDSEYDDTFLAVLSGPGGAVAQIVNSVNKVCAGGQQQPGTFPGQPDGGDADYKETGKLPFTLTGTVGSPAHLTFVVTDVGDAILSTVVGIDDIVVGP